MRHVVGGCESGWSAISIPCDLASRMRLWPGIKGSEILVSRYSPVSLEVVSFVFWVRIKHLCLQDCAKGT